MQGWLPMEMLEEDDIVIASASATSDTSYTITGSWLVSSYKVFIFAVLFGCTHIFHLLLPTINIIIFIWLLNVSRAREKKSNSVKVRIWKTYQSLGKLDLVFFSQINQSWTKLKLGQYNLYKVRVSQIQFFNSLTHHDKPNCNEVFTWTMYIVH